jgi:hypothetical protein
MPEPLSARADQAGYCKDLSAAQDAEGDVRVPHQVALGIFRGQNPVRAFRNHQRLSIGQLAKQAGVAAGYIAEVERGIKPGSPSALARLAGALGTTADILAGRAELSAPATTVTSGVDRPSLPQT